MKKTVLAVSLSASIFLLFPIAASADVGAESFLQLGSSHRNFEDGDNGRGIDLEGYHVKGNLALSDNTYVSYQRSVTDIGGVELEIKDLGLGYQSALSASAAVFIQLDKSYYSIDSDSRRFDLNDTGYRASIGVRKLMTDSLEVNASYQYADIGEQLSDIFAVGAIYSFSSKMALYANYEREQDYDHLSVGVRLTF
jgi:opacity protein-like surface antigen